MITSEQTVYVVEDDRAVRDSLRALLMSAGYTVEVFGSSEEFLEAWPLPARGCILLDLNGPKMGSFHVLEALEERHVDIPVILISGRIDAATRAFALKAGAVALLEKPLEQVSLFEAIRHALNPDTGVMTEVIIAVLKELEAEHDSLTPEETAKICIHVYDELLRVGPDWRKERAKYIAGSAIRLTKRDRACRSSHDLVQT